MPSTVETVMQLEANVDDLDPRLWPHVLERLLAAGALDAWLTPIIMKKGRPAFIVSAMCHPSESDAVRDVFFTETTTIGVRHQLVERTVLDRTVHKVDVNGEPVAIKQSTRNDDVLNRSVEWDDVVAAAQALGLSAKQVLALATAAAQDLD